MLEGAGKKCSGLSAAVALVALLSLQAMSAPPAHAARPTIAVADLAGDGVPAGLASVVSDALRTDMHRFGAYEVLDRKAVRAMLKEAELQQLGVTRAKTLPLGKIKGADKLVVGSLGKAGERYVVNLRRFDVTSGKVEVALKDEKASSPEGLLDAVAALADELADRPRNKGQQARRLAIMAFADDSGDPALASVHIGEMMAEALGQGLSDDPGIRVLSLLTMRARLEASGRKFADTSRPKVARELAADLRADLVITGRLARLGKSFVVTTQVSQAQGEEVLGGGRSQAASAEALIGAALDAHASAVLEYMGRSRRDTPRIEGFTTPSMQAYRHFMVGSELHLAGRYAQGAEALEKAVAADADFASAWSVLSCARSFLGQDAASKSALDKALANADSVSARESLWISGNAAWVSEDPQLARLHYLRYTRLYPDDREGWFYLGLAEHWQLGRYAEAVKAYDRALQITPASFALHKAKADALEAAGDKKRARATLRGFLKGHPKSPDANAAKQRLAQLK